MRVVVGLGSPQQVQRGQTTHKTGPRGGKIKSTVYRDWGEANGGKWVGFQWKLLGDPTHWFI